MTDFLVVIGNVLHTLYNAKHPPVQFRLKRGQLPRKLHSHTAAASYTLCKQLPTHRKPTALRTDTALQPKLLTCERD